MTKELEIQGKRKTKMRIKTTVINSLGEYIDYISEIAQREEKKLVQPKVLWFRGQPDVEHMLVPTIFRENVRVGVDAGNYSSLQIGRASCRERV